MIPKDLVNKEEQVKKLSRGLREDFPVFNVKMSISPTQTFFQGCNDFTSAFITPEWHFLSRETSLQGGSKADSGDNYLICRRQRLDLVFLI